MQKEVVVKIKNKILMEGEKQTMSYEAAGQYFEKNGAIYVMYEESQEEMMNKCRLKLQEDTVELNKKGGVQVTMLFEKGQNHKTGYITPYGTFGMEVKTKELLCQKEAERIHIHVVYELDLNDAPLSHNDLHMEIVNADAK